MLISPVKAVWPRSLHARLLSDCLGLVAGGDRCQGGGFEGMLVLCREEKKKTTLFTEKERQWPVAFLEGQRSFVGKTGSQDFQDLPGHSQATCPSFRPFSQPPTVICSLVHPLWVQPSARCLGLQLSGKAACQSSQHGDRTPSQRDRCHTEHLLPTFLTAVNLTGTAGLLMPSSTGSHSEWETH